MYMMYLSLIHSDSLAREISVNELVVNDLLGTQQSKLYNRKYFVAP
jgi:hypothetical protein